jgi:hypothetical protein
VLTHVAPEMQIYREADVHDALFWIYLINAILLTNHEIDCTAMVEYMLDTGIKYEWLTFRNRKHVPESHCRHCR